MTHKTWFWCWTLIMSSVSSLFWGFATIYSLGIEIPMCVTVALGVLWLVSSDFDKAFGKPSKDLPSWEGSLHTRLNEAQAKGDTDLYDNLLEEYAVKLNLPKEEKPKGSAGLVFFEEPEWPRVNSQGETVWPKDLEPELKQHWYWRQVNGKWKFVSELKTPEQIEILTEYGPFEGGLSIDGVVQEPLLKARGFLPPPGPYGASYTMVSKYDGTRKFYSDGHVWRCQKGRAHRPWTAAEEQEHIIYLDPVRRTKENQKQADEAAASQALRESLRETAKRRAQRRRSRS